MSRRRLPATPSPACELLRDHLREIYASPMPWHTHEKLQGREEITATPALMPFEGPGLVEAAQGPL